MFKNLFAKNELRTVFFISLSTYLFYFGRLFLPNHFFWYMDTINYYLPVREYLFEKITQEFTFPFWTERAYLGFPIYADIEAGYLNLFNVITIVFLGPEFSYKFLHILCYLLGSISFYYFLKKYNIDLFGYFAANLIYFFNLTSIYHQIHFNITLAIFLFPLSILLLDKYLKEEKIRYILIQSIIISFIFLLGHTPTVINYCMGLLVYFGVSIYQLNIRKILQKSLLYGLFLFLFFLIQTLPQIIPTYQIYKESYRSETINFTEGSFYPKMLVLMIYPDLFSVNQKYLGHSINYYFYQVETYIYVGISTGIIFILGFLFTKFDKFNLFAQILFLIFVILATAAFNPFFTKDTFLISLFRNWSRFSFVFYFATSFLAARFISNLSQLDFKDFKKRAIFLCVPLFYLIILNFTIIENDQVRILNTFFSPEYLFSNKSFKIWLNIIFLVLILTILTLFKDIIFQKLNIKFKPKTLKFFFCLVVLIDFAAFTVKESNSIIIDKTKYTLLPIPKEYNESRVIISNSKAQGFEFLKYQAWSPFGFSNFLQKDFYDFMVTKNFNRHYLLNHESKSDLLIDFEPISLGLMAAFNVTDNSLDRTFQETKKLELIANNVNGKYLVKEEGHLKIKFNLSNPETINTKIRYSPNWQVSLNDQKIDFEKIDIFISFKAPSGESVVEFKYIPKPFYLGLYISGVLLILLIVILSINRKYKLIEI